ncbi:MAG: lysylphosphatidylglycerol synthase transmembrane domain-containing protein [bacterium]|nr:lysylphosphatidylglycerol synthase transmembrane domain-containing protein [bacterium]
MSKYSRKLSLYGGVAISLACVWWVLRSVDLTEIARLLSAVRMLPLLTAVVITVVGYVLRAWRWRYFFAEKAPSISASYRCVILGFFMNNILPARMGEFVRAHLGGKATGLSRTTVLATIAGERLADGVMISLIFSGLFTFAARDAQALQEGKALLYVSFLFALAALIVFLLLVFRRSVYRLIEVIAGRLKGRASRFALVRIRRFIEGLEPLLRPKRLFWIIIGSVLVWGIELFAYAKISEAFGQDLGLSYLSLFLAAVNFSSLIPAAPGGIGVIEAFATAALVHVGIEPEPALAMVAIQHLMQMLVVGVPGGWLFFRELHGHLPQAEAADSEEEYC